MESETTQIGEVFRTVQMVDVRGFQVHLVSTGISWPAPNQFVCTLRFFNGVTLGEAVIPERIPYAQEPRELLVTLSPDEVVQELRPKVGDGMKG
jgi:integrase/recombinase XerD